MKLKYSSLLLAASAASLATSPVSAQEAQTLVEALKNSKTQLHLRARYEGVEQDGVDNASATTLKTRLTFTSGTYQGFGLTLEMDDTTELGKKNYSDGVTNRGTAVIADPQTTEVNQWFISYTLGATTAKYGRQRIILDNQRFVGGVGWRQDEQTYDAFSVASKPLEGLSLFYAYVTHVNRIFAEALDHNHDSHLLNAKYETPFGAIIGYGYLLDIDTPGAINLSSDTFGLRWQGKINQYVSYNLEYAAQQDAGDSTLDYSTDYNLAELLLSFPVTDLNINVKLGYEKLGSDGGQAVFTTPLATLHAFQGWTDKFLVMPAAGVRDAYASVGSSLWGTQVSVVYNQFKADYGSAKYGDEWGFVMARPFGPVGVTLKYSDYSADTLHTDTRKLWLMAAVTF